MDTKHQTKEIANRILAAIKHSGQSQRQIALAIGISPQALNRWTKTGRASKEALLEFCNVTNVDLQWIISGQNRSDIHVGEAVSPYELGSDFDFDNDPTNSSRISKEFPFKAVDIVSESKFNNSIIQSSKHKEYPNGVVFFYKKWLLKKDLNFDNLLIIIANDDSMEPTINRNEIVLLDTSSKYRSINNIKDGRIYGVNYSEETSIKRLFKKPGGGIIVRSDSSAHQWRDLHINESDMNFFSIIGLAVWHAGDL